MARVPVLINSEGGAASAEPDIEKTVGHALKSAGLDPEVELIGGGDCEVRCRAIAERGDELVIVGGGDGTIAAAASALIGTHTKLGVLPLGTLNHFARDLGVPTDVAEAAKLIASGKERHVDVAELNDRVFINNSAVGLYPLMVLDRDLQRKRLGRSKKLAMIVASVRTLARFGHQRLTLTVNDEKERVDTPLLFVGNNSYRVDLGAPGQRESSRRRAALRDGHAPEDPPRFRGGHDPCAVQQHARRRSGADRRCRAVAGFELAERTSDISRR